MYVQLFRLKIISIIFYTYLHRNMDLKLIKTVSAQKKMNLEDLAKLANVKRATFFNYLSGKTSIPADVLKKLSDILQIPIAQIYNESNNLELSEFQEPTKPYSSEKTKGIPFVHRFVHSDYLLAYDDEEYIGSLPKYPVITDQLLNSNYICFEVADDSMYDKSYQNRLEGDIILAREIKQSQWGSVLSIAKNNFIILHKKEGLLIKRIISHNKEARTILAHSLNAQFEDTEICTDHILSLFYEVKLVGRNSGV